MRDSIWQFIGAVLVIVSIAVSVIVYFLQKSRKLLSYEILSETALLSVAKEVEDKIKILFEGDVVKRVHLILVRISNTGNVPILPSDFLKDLTVSFSGSAKILSAEISEKHPESIDSRITIDGTQLIISPSLWNSGDTITVKSLVSEFNENTQVSGRIVGIQDIKLSRSSINSNSALLLFFSTILILVCLILIGVTEQPVFLVLGLVGYILAILPAAYDKKYRELFFSVVNTMGAILRS